MSDAITPEILKFIRRIQIETGYLAKDFLAGVYRSAFRGKGIEFYDTREYQPGDEVRHIDWNQSSRSNRLYVKTYREERQLNITLAIDISSSQRFGTRELLKSQLMTEIGAVLAFSALRNNDRVGLLLYSDTIEKYLPPRQNLRHILRVVRELVVTIPHGKRTDTAAALSFLGKVQIKPGICFLLSDFLCPDFSKQASLIAQKHDLIGIAISDPGEKNLPIAPLLSVEDLETGDQVLVSSDRNVHEQLIKQAQTRLEENKSMMHRIGADFIEVQTDQPYLPILRKFFKFRAKR